MAGKQHIPRPNSAIASMLHVGWKAKRKQPATPTQVRWSVSTSPGMVVIRIDGLRLTSETNAREHWSRRYKRTQMQQAILKAALLSVNLWHWVALPLRVTTCRVAPRRYDTDNAVSSTKHLRDGIAKELGIDDRDVRIDWQVAQKRGEPKVYAVEIVIESMKEASNV